MKQFNNRDFRLSVIIILLLLLLGLVSDRILPKKESVKVASVGNSAVSPSPSPSSQNTSSSTQGGCKCGAGSGSGSSSQGTSDATKQIEKDAYDYYVKKYNDPDVTVEVVNYGCHFGINIKKGDQVVKKLTYSGGNFYEN